MKNIFLFVAIALASISMAQDTDFYMAAGLSVSNTGDNTFAYSSYPAIEIGITQENFSLGLVAGRSNLIGFDTDEINNYWYELKTALSFPAGKFCGYGLLGIGNYMSTERIFIEYGVGLSRTYNKVGMFTQASNWDGYWYVTPGISYTF